MPVLLNAPNNAIPRMSRLSSYPLGALRLSRFARDLGCIGILTFRGGKPFLIGGQSSLASTNGPTVVRTEEGLAFDLTAASSQSANGIIAPTMINSTNISVVARLKFRTLPATAAPAIMWSNTANHRGVGVGCDSSGHALAACIMGTSTQTVSGTNVFTSFVTVGASSFPSVTVAGALYENGVFIGNTADAGAAASAFQSEIRLGRDFGATLNFFDGQIAWAALFNQQLNAAQHFAVYAHPERLLALKYPVLTGSMIAGGGTNFTPPQAAWNWNGFVPVIDQRTQFIPPRGLWNWTGNLASLKSQITPPLKPWNWNAFAPTIAGNTNITPPQKIWSWTGFVPTINSKTQITPPQKAWSWTGFAPSFNSKTMFTPPTVVWRWVGNAISGFGSKIAPLLKLMGMGT